MSNQQQRRRRFLRIKRSAHIMLRHGHLLIVIGIAQWVVFSLVTKSVVTNPFLLLIEFVILAFTFGKFWQALRVPWPNNFWPAFIALMYVSQFLALMSILDWSIAAWLSHSFIGGQHPYGLTKIDAFYFAVTTFSTVGYGDIHPNSPVAKLVVAFQIILGLLLTIVFLGVFVSQLVSRLSSKASSK